MEQISGKVKTTGPHAAAKNAECGLFYFGGDTDISLPVFLAIEKRKYSPQSLRSGCISGWLPAPADIPLFKLAGYSFGFNKYCEEVIHYKEEEHEDNSFNR
jgi:hypothetical protein